MPVYPAINAVSCSAQEMGEREAVSLQGEIQPEAILLPDAEGLEILAELEDLRQIYRFSLTLDEWLTTCVHSFPGDYCRPLMARGLEFNSDLVLLRISGQEFPDEVGAEILMDMQLENYSFLPQDLVIDFGLCLFENPSEQCIDQASEVLDQCTSAEANPYIYI